MRSIYSASVCAASLIAGAEAVKTKQDDWWMADASMDGGASNLENAPEDNWWTNGEPVLGEAQQIADRQTAEDAAISLAKEEAVAAEAADQAGKQAATADVARMAAEEKVERLADEENQQCLIQEEASTEAARLVNARLETEEIARQQDAAFIPEQAAKQEAAMWAANQAAVLKAQSEMADKEATRLAQEATEAEGRRLTAAMASELEAKRFAAEEEAQIEGMRQAEAEATRLLAERMATEEEATRQAIEQEAQLETQRIAADEAANIEIERQAAEQEAASIVAKAAAQAQLEELLAKEAEAVAVEDVVEESVTPAQEESPIAVEEATTTDETVATEEAPVVVEDDSTDLMAAFLAMDALDAKKAEETAVVAVAEPVSAVADALKMSDEVADAWEEAASEVPEAPVVAEAMEEESCSLPEATVAAEVEETPAEVVEATVDPLMMAKKEVAEVVMQESGELYGMQHFPSELTMDQAEEIASTLVEGAAVELATAGATEEEVNFSVISAALFNLSTEEISELQQMEEIVMEREDEIADMIANSDDPELIQAAADAIDALEGELDTIVVVEQNLMATMQGSDLAEALAVPEPKPITCEDCAAAYVDAIAALTAQESAITVMTDAMASSLADIDPNTENGQEGQALLRKMYKLRGIEPENFEYVMPETPADCVLGVAGKVLHLEILEEDVAKAASYRDFFADVYCAAYVNSLVTMNDGLSQIFPGGLDWMIEEELQRAYGPFEADQLDIVEISAIDAYMSAIEAGSFSDNDGDLIPSVTPLADAIERCDPIVTGEIDGAKQDRADHLYDHNFLRYLKTM